jgi:hypothetical protein
MLFVIEKQLAVYRQRIEELFARHPDHDLFGSLPGAGLRSLRACWPRLEMTASDSTAPLAFDPYVGFVDAQLSLVGLSLERKRRCNFRGVALDESARR